MFFRNMLQVYKHCYACMRVCICFYVLSDRESISEPRISFNSLCVLVGNCQDLRLYTYRLPLRRHHVHPVLYHRLHCSLGEFMQSSCSLPPSSPFHRVVLRSIGRSQSYTASGRGMGARHRRRHPTPHTPLLLLNRPPVPRKDSLFSKEN